MVPDSKMIRRMTHCIASCSLQVIHLSLNPGPSLSDYKSSCSNETLLRLFFDPSASRESLGSLHYIIFLPPPKLPSIISRRGHPNERSHETEIRKGRCRWSIGQIGRVRGRAGRERTNTERPETKLSVASCVCWDPRDVSVCTKLTPVSLVVLPVL